MSKETDVQKLVDHAQIHLFTGDPDLAQRIVHEGANINPLLREIMKRIVEIEARMDDEV
jgi:hypothetical protein